MPTHQQTSPASAAQVIVLNGTSSSGKTTLAKAMQASWASPLLHVQLDAFRDMEPPGYWHEWEKLDESLVDSMVCALCSAMYAAVREYAKHGQGVVLDTVLNNRHARRLLVEHLADLPVYLVGVHCDPSELTRREAARGNREIGLAARQVEWIHKPMHYDFQVETTAREPEEAAAEISRWFAGRPTPTAFVHFAAQLNAA
jgi:chloramphenicol 3-O phosphotransferase